MAALVIFTKSKMQIRAASIKAIKTKEPVVVMNVREYKALIEYLEDLEDRVAVRERSKEPNIPLGEVERRFRKKFGRK
jgi:hypothetical protein